MSTQSKRMVVGLLLLMLAAYAALSVRSTWSAQRRLEEDRRDLLEIQFKLAEIEKLAEAPVVAALDIEPPDAIVNRINAAVKQAGLPETAFENQTPGTAERIGRTDFTLRKVDIQLNAATVQQIVAFCEALRDESTGSVVRDLHLFNPKKSGARETWESQLILTQTIFSPKSEP